jgi:signal transduction histidine kinase
MAAIAVTVLDERAISVNQLRLLTLQVEQLTAANRRKDEFLAIVSHELRSPLASIMYASGILRRQLGADVAIQRRMHELIERQARQMAFLATALLDVDRINSGRLRVQLERVDLRAVLARAVETLELDFRERNQDLTTTSAIASVWVMADAGRLEQVFVNLLANASKYTDHGGQVSLSLSAEDGHATVRIRDSGIGISAQALPHIFELYAQVDHRSPRSSLGMGIGLAVARTIVQLHGGSVSAMSAGLGQGSEFTVSLPAQGLPLFGKASASSCGT